MEIFTVLQTDLNDGTSFACGTFRNKDAAIGHQSVIAEAVLLEAGVDEDDIVENFDLMQETLTIDQVQTRFEVLTIFASHEMVYKNFGITGHRQRVQDITAEILAGMVSHPLVKNLEDHQDTLVQQSVKMAKQIIEEV